MRVRHMSEKAIRHVIRFPPDVYEKLREIAEQEDRSINWEVVAAVRLLVEQHAQRTSPTPDDTHAAARPA
jgi:hypothetical protein